MMIRPGAVVVHQEVMIDGVEHSEHHALKTLEIFRPPLWVAAQQFGRAGAAMRRANALGFQISEIKAQAREEYGVDIADMGVPQLQAFCAELEGTLAAFEAAE